MLECVPVKDNKIFIPKSLQAELLENLNAAHQGINDMLDNVRQCMFWSGIDASVQQTRAQCVKCNEILPSQPWEPLAEPPLTGLTISADSSGLLQDNGQQVFTL